MKTFLTTIFAIILLLVNADSARAAEEMKFVRVTEIGAENFVRELRYVPNDFLIEFEDIQRTPQFDSAEDNMGSWLNIFSANGEHGFIFYLVNPDGYISTIGVSSESAMERRTLTAVVRIVLTCVGLTEQERDKLLNSPEDVRSVYGEKIRRRIWLASDSEGTAAIIATER